MLRLGKFSAGQKKNRCQSNSLPRPRRVRFSLFDFRIYSTRKLYIAKILNSARRGFVCVVRVASAAAGRYRYHRCPDSDPAFKSVSRWLNTARLVGNKMVNVTIYDEAPKLKVRQSAAAVHNWSIKIHIISWLAESRVIRYQT